ncbi:MAG TPA: long-chain fatty acid--CoA ligase [Thermoplasmata archaeon]
MIPDGPARPWFAHYEKGVPHSVEIPERRLPELVADSVARWPDRVAFHHYGARWTYREFWSQSGRFASALHRAGFVPGDRLALYLPNCPMYPIAFFAALRLGLVVVQVSPLYLGQDLARLLGDAQPKGLVTLEILYPNVAKVEADVPIDRIFVARLREFYPRLKRPFVNLVLRRRGHPTGFPRNPRVTAWREALREGGEFPEFHGDPAREVAVLQYTGGTTGRPKAAMLSHRNLVANALQCRAWFQSEPGTGIVLAAIPFFHVYGMTVALNHALLEGASVVLETRPDPSEILELIERYHPTEFPAVPALYQAINHHPRVGRYDIRSIRVCLSGSAPLPVEVAREFEALTGGRLIEGYGLTEASPVTHANPIEGERRAGSIGLPFPDTDQRVVDVETGGRTLGTGEAGELCVRGPQVMLGYYRQPEETAQVLRDGWLFTGDVATIDADGYAYIVDRKKDIVVVGGFKVYPREVEEVLFQHPAVAEAAAIGVPDPVLGEVIKAFVVLRPGARATAEELIRFVRERIAHYKAPRSVDFRTNLPRSGIQKVLRRELRDEPPPAEAPTAPA